MSKTHKRCAVCHCTFSGGARHAVCPNCARPARDVLLRLGHRPGAVTEAADSDGFE
jgi:hypothetical protein